MKRFLERFVKSEEVADDLEELLLGIVIFCLLSQIVLLILFPDKAGYHAAGLWIGAVMALAGAIHIAWSLNVSLDLGSEGAMKKMRIYAMIRYGVAVVVMGALMILNVANPLTAFLGLMGLKAGAYMQPVLHKAAVRLGWKKDRIKPLLSPEEVDELIREEKAQKQ